ncbi:MAG: ATP-binding cassette domain-containing protein [Pseudomonadota bacterium]
MIELSNVAMRYGDRTLFDDVSVTLEAGSFHFLTGPSGAGKTTLLKLCSMELQPSGGQVHLMGAETASLDRDAQAEMRQKIGVVHQDSLFVDHLSISENVLLPASVSRGDATPMQNDLEQLLGWVGLSERADQTPPELSGGERQRAALARAIILSPEVVLADEPTGNVDWDMSLKLLDLLIELNRLGKTILCATHDLNLIRQAKSRISAKVLRLKRGVLDVAGAGL